MEEQTLQEWLREVQLEWHLGAFADADLFSVDDLAVLSNREDIQFLLPTLPNIAVLRLEKALSKSDAPPSVEATLYVTHHCAGW